MGEKTGKAKEVAGWVTGDRQVEAEGRVEQGDQEPSEEATERETKRVRDEHGEYDDTDAGRE
jgi:uncharacterized protein YjbJ (UPF0337 family)